MNLISPRREPAHLVVDRVGSVVSGNESLPWLLLDENGDEYPAVRDFLRHMVSCDYGNSSVRSYALALQRWLRFLRAIGVGWDRAVREDTRDFVLWMRAASPARPTANRVPGSVNQRTGKRYLGNTFVAATINHNLAVVSSFYDYHIGMCSGPLINPAPPRSSRRGGRVDAHHNPLDPFRPGRRGAYRQRVPQRSLRAMPDGMFDELFQSMGSHRDRALLAFYVSCGARPAEPLGVTGARLDFGEQLVCVSRKGTRAMQWLPASPDAFVWLLLYQNELPIELIGGHQPVWWTRRRPWRPLTYDALRAVLRRANANLDTNWTLHDLRHTYAIRMANDPKVPLVSLQVLLGHAHLSSTQRYLQSRLEEVLSHAREYFRRQAGASQAEPDPAYTLGYDNGDLDELFGWPGASR